MKGLFNGMSQAGSAEFTRQGLIAAELDQIVIETGSIGATPEMTLGRVLQQLRKVGTIEFLGRGAYRLRNPSPLLAPSKGVFVVGAQADHEDRSAMFHRIAAAWVEVATRTVGSWLFSKAAGARDKLVTMR